MRVSSLKPIWLEAENGTRHGFMILCPHCVARGRPPGKRTWLTCFSVPTKHGDQRILIQRALDRMGPETAESQNECDVVGCKQDFAWLIQTQPPGGEVTFENMTVQPSLNANPAGHWHGTIANGEASDAGEQPA